MSIMPSIICREREFGMWYLVVVVVVAAVVVVVVCVQNLVCNMLIFDT